MGDDDNNKDTIQKDMPRSCCACINVECAPEDVGASLIRAKWACPSCGMEFVKKPTVQRRNNIMKEKVAEIIEILSDVKNSGEFLLDGRGNFSYRNGNIVNYYEVLKADQKKQDAILRVESLIRTFTLSV